MTILPDQLAVVPIFVNAGAAVLPAVLGGASSMIALLFRPKALVAACRAKPGVAGGVVVGLLAVCLGGWWMFSGPSGDAARKPPGVSLGGSAMLRRDWAQVARELIQQEGNSVNVSTTQPSTQPTTAMVLGGDYSRAAFAGGQSPLGLVPSWEHVEDQVSFLSSPLVVGDRVYVASYKPDIIGVFGEVYCLDAKTGRPIWQVGKSAEDEPFKPFFSSPALSADGKSILIGQGLHEDKDCSLLCLDAATGIVRWKVQTPLHLESSPAVKGDMVVIGAGAIEDSDHKNRGDPGFVLAVRISDGKVLWKQPVNDPESTPAIDDDGNVYIGSGVNGNAIVALRGRPDDELKAKNLDRVLWKTPAKFPITGTVSLVNDLAIVGGGNGDFVYANPQPAGVVVALDRKTGVVRWEVAMPDAVLGNIAHRDGVLICPVRNGEVVALNATDGAVLWRQRFAGESPVLAGPAFTGKCVYAVSRDGFLGILDGKSGKVLEKITINGDGKPGEKGLCLSGPFVANGRIYVGTETGGVRCYNGKRAAE